MIKTYAVVFQNSKTRRVQMDTFSGCSETEARHGFHECYRHGDTTFLL